MNTGDFYGCQLIEVCQLIEGVPCYTCYSFGGELGFEETQCLSGEMQIICLQRSDCSEPPRANSSHPSHWDKSNPSSSATQSGSFSSLARF